MEIGGVCLGFDRIALLFFLGPAEGGGNLILIEGDGEVTVVNSNDIAHDAHAYELAGAPDA